MEPSLAMVHLVALVGGLALLIYGANMLVKGAVHLSRAAGISSFVIGLTVVAFGTSAPELGASLRAAIEGDPGLAVGNVVGSNIANIGLILGVTALICPIPVKLHVVRMDAIIMLVMTFIAVLLMLGAGMNRIEGGVLVFLLLVFITRSYIEGRKPGDETEAANLVEAERELEEDFGAKEGGSILVSILLVAGGLVMLYFGSGWLVSGAEALAEMAGVSSAVIGLSLVAFGTSVPELAVSVVGALRKKPDVAIGNILGSNIFNLLCVLGFAGLFSPEPLPTTEGFWIRDAPVMLVLSIAVIPIMLRGGRISRIEGALLLGLYGGYLGVLFATSR